MSNNSPSLFIEINKSEYIFTVGEDDEQDNLKVIYKCIVPVQGIQNYKITDLSLVIADIKKNIYLIEQKLNHTFKETILIINNFNYSFINLTGFKKLNGSQILKENISYIINSIKTNIDETESKKTILHIFNSKYFLDKKKIENLPIGLFGDFYSHELSFCLINNNDYKNLINILNKCNIKTKKILIKGFVEGSFISNENENLDTFIQIKIGEKDSQILRLEKSESFFLWTEIKESKIVNTKFNSKYNIGFRGNYTYWGADPNEKRKYQYELDKIESDGKLFKFSFKDQKSITYLSSLSL